MMPENELSLKQTENAAPRKRFWRRQFQKDATAPQRRFDWIFGVILPVICFVADPIVFKGTAGGQPLFGDYKTFAYLLSFVMVMSLSAFLIWGKKLKWLNSILAGVFAVSATISLIIGVVIFPFSLLGLIWNYIIGILGFTPFLTAIVCLRNSIRAVKTAQSFLRKQVLTSIFVLSAVVSFTLPFGLNGGIPKAKTKTSFIKF